MRIRKLNQHYSIVDVIRKYMGCLTADPTIAASAENAAQGAEKAWLHVQVCVCKVLGGP